MANEIYIIFSELETILGPQLSGMDLELNDEVEYDLNDEVFLELQKTPET